MDALDPIDLLFGGMDQLGPGSDACTLHALRRLPVQEFSVIVDAGCGTGRQTLALARALGTVVHAVDAHAPFLAHLTRRAEAAGIGHLVRMHHMDMKERPGGLPADRLALVGRRRVQHWLRQRARRCGRPRSVTAGLPS